MNDTTEPTLREETIHMIDHANIDLDYARQQLRRAQNCGTRRTMLNCISRAQDALDRVADAHGSAVIMLGNATMEPGADQAEEWTIDEILAREG